MKVAIIGSGISGSVAAHHLHRRCDLTVFEADSRIGGHTHTVQVEHAGQSWAIDTGFIVYNEPNYPHFSRLLRELEVPTQPTSMSFAVRCDRTGLEYNGTGLNRLFAQRRNCVRWSFWRMLSDILRFGRQAPRLLDDESQDPTVEEFLHAGRYSPIFREHYLVPLGAALWSCPPDSFRQFQMRFVVRFLHNHAMLQLGGRPVWRVIRGGSQNYSDKLTAPFRACIRTGTPVVNVRRVAGRLQLRTAAGESEAFDHVIFACHADQALRILEQPLPVERQVLACFPYQRNIATLHTDESVLPTRRLARASWNVHLPADRERFALVTYNMNLLQSLKAPCTFCVTLNDDGRIDPARVLRRITYHHPLYFRDRVAAQRRHRELIDLQGVSYCGAYWGYGFHEDGVTSAMRVADVLLMKQAVPHV